MPEDVPDSVTDPERLETVQVVHETMTAQARRIVTGVVRVSTQLVEEKHTLGLDLASETVEVTRVPLDLPVSEPPPVRTDGPVTIIPVVEERVVVQRQLVLVEEVHVRRIPETRQEEVPVTLRRHVVDVAHLGPADPPSRPDADTQTSTVPKTGEDHD